MKTGPPLVEEVSLVESGATQSGRTQSWGVHSDKAHTLQGLHAASPHLADRGGLREQLPHPGARPWHQALFRLGGEGVVASGGERGTSRP